MPLAKLGLSAGLGLITAGAIYAGVLYLRTHPTMPWTPYPPMIEVTVLQPGEVLPVDPPAPTPMVQPQTVRAKTLKKLPD